MYRIPLHRCASARSSSNILSAPTRRAALLGALFLAASLPASSLAAEPGTVGAGSQPIPGARPGSGPGQTGASNPGTGGGRQFLYRFRGSKRKLTRGGG
jgi:hypothetical protein